MRVAMPHNMTKTEARSRVEQKLFALVSQFSHQAEDMQHEWIGDTLHFKGKARGMKVEGTVEVTDDSVIIDGKLPLIAMPFESRIKEAVQREADTIFRA
jgi:hypothetical protein